MSELILPGEKKIIALKPNAPVKAADGSHWKSGLDMLKELVNDLEHDRLMAPEVVYVAMQSRHPVHREMVAHPSYCWTNQEIGSLGMIGLLEKHKFKLMNGGK